MSEKILSQILEEVQAINERLEKIESKLNIAYEQTANHSEIIDKLDEFATKEDLSYIDKKLCEHDREIFKLKNRA